VAAIVLYEKQQVVIHQEDGPVGSPPSSGWGHLCHAESRGPDRRGSNSTAAMGRWDTYAQPYSP
jgi:hypothetical protein